MRNRKHALRVQFYVYNIFDLLDRERVKINKKINEKDLRDLANLEKLY
jgi:hypothetical protein